MGLDVYSKALVGFPVKEADLWETVTDKVETCERGHRGSVRKSGHCPKCGGRLRRAERHVATPGLRRLVGRGSVAKTPENMGKIGLVEIDGGIVLSVTVASSGSHRSARETAAVTRREVDAAFNKAEKARDAVGVRSEVRLYLLMDVSC